MEQRYKKQLHDIWSKTCQEMDTIQEQTSQGDVQYEKDFSQIWVAQEETESMTEIFKKRFDKDLQCTPPFSVADMNPVKAK